MYTRCTECRTIFRIAREHLHAARGQVRCGRCGATFDALQSLREELPNELVEAQSELELERRPGPPAPELGFELELEEPLVGPPRRGRTWPWVVASVLLTLTLTIQVVHLFRAELAAHPALGPVMQQVYGSIGLVLPDDPRTDLGAFSLLHHEMVSHPRMAEGLHLSGVLVNEAGFAQPWPLLELRLEDRFGDMVAARRLAPAEYLRNPPREGELMPAHARRAIEIELVDPGSDAIGFSIDFCIELRAGLHCATSTPVH